MRRYDEDPHPGDRELFALAKAAHPEPYKLARWCGASGCSRRVYTCYVCGATIDTEAGQYPMTVHAHEAILAHGDSHLEVIQ